MDNYGGPVWHASGKGKKTSVSRRIALDALRGVGDRKLGEWCEEGTSGIVHVQRRLSELEREQFGIPDPIDIRGTYEEKRRLRVVLREAPYLRTHPAFRTVAAAL